MDELETYLQRKLVVLLGARGGVDPDVLPTGPPLRSVYFFFGHILDMRKFPGRRWSPHAAVTVPDPYPLGHQETPHLLLD